MAQARGAAGRLSTPVLPAVAGIGVVAGPLLSFLPGPVCGYEASGRGSVSEPACLTGWDGLGRFARRMVVRDGAASATAHGAAGVAGGPARPPSVTRVCDRA
ncbi:hypothetical protein ACFXG6_07510 [Streptomyces roseus]|uniref:hypothetical protein n=1 Tax=Streptomyces roseus TaxID=66430 RepID=UPI0036CBCA4A